MVGASVGGRRARTHTGARREVLEIELRFGDSTVMIADEFPEIGVLSPKSVGGTYGALHVATEDVDALWKGAVDAGAEVHQPLRELFWGDRHGQIIDPFGHRWGLSQHVRDVPPDEIARRGGGVRWLGLLQLRKPLKIRALVLRTVTDTLGPRSRSR